MARRPPEIDSRFFYRCAVQRLEDADALLDSERTTGAVYMAGYAIECALKALLLSVLSVANRRKMVRTFRGVLAHDFEWLKAQYLRNGGARPPTEIQELLTTSYSAWATDLRYKPGNVGRHDAFDFLESARRILNWAKRGL